MGSTVQTLKSVDEAVAWLRARQATSLTLDSRTVHSGEAWFAWPGAQQDPRQFVVQALQKGASACLLEAKGLSATTVGELDSSAVALMVNLKVHAGEIASRFWGKPSHQLRMVAVTGTNGKTSCTWWIAQALTSLGERCGVIGTLGVGEPGSSELTGTGLTTPDALTLHKHLARMRDEGFKACAIEASSIGIAEGRLNGLRLDVAVLTNFTQDHLDYHGDMQSYWQAKAQLFAWPGLKTAVINGDDPHGIELIHRPFGTKKLSVCTFSTQNRTADLFAQKVHFENGALHLTVREFKDAAGVHAPVIGDHNVFNLLAVMGALRGLGYTLIDAARACSQLLPVPGRMQEVTYPGQSDTTLPKVVVDYAHTPDALEKALLALKPLVEERPQTCRFAPGPPRGMRKLGNGPALSHARGGQLWCVFGCGGNRDAGKRPLMGAVAERLAQAVIVTSDNPRHESAEAIISQIMAGTSPDAAARIQTIVDRAKAIAHAIDQAQPQDLILIAGKGHETTQEIQGVVQAFSDVTQAQNALQQRLERERSGSARPSSVHFSEVSCR